MQASMEPGALPAKEKAAAVTTTPGKPVDKATTKVAAARPTTLLDVQEVEWITRELERLLAREKQSGDDAADGDAGRHQRKRARVSRAAPAPAAHKGGFLADLLGRHAVSICSGDAGVDHSSAAGAVVGDRGRRRSGRGSFREVEKV